MKTLYSVLFGAALLTVLAFTSFTSTTVAQNHPRQAGAVVFAAEMSYSNGREVGYRTYVISKGPSAPAIQVGDDLAATMETLLASGYEITALPGFQFMAIRR